MKVLFLLILCLPLLCNGKSSDQTLQIYARGEAVVDAVIEKIRSKCILTEDKYLMKRIAAVETDFGKNAGQGTGGIWKITDVMLSSVKSNCQGALRPICNQILQIFSLDITTSTISDMDVPLYSGLVIDAYITSLDKPIPAARSDQADFWIKYIRPQGSKYDFMNKSDMKFNCSSEMELVFVIDASGSVTLTNFNKTLSFLQNVVRNLKIASDKIRVAVVRFSTSATVSFNLGTHNSVSSLIDEISKIDYIDGGTSTSMALDLARTNVFTNARKNVPKVLVLITDGHSNNENDTLASADDLKTNATTIFTIGIGAINENEIRAVSSSPSCTHYYELKSYNEIDAIIRAIQSEACAVPATIYPTPNATATKEVPLSIVTTTTNVQIPSSNTSDSGIHIQITTKVKIDVSCGIVHMYASHDFDKPSAAIHTYSAVATDGKPGVIRYPANKILYLKLVSQMRLDLSITACLNPHYNITINTGNKVTIICRENGVERQCTKKDIEDSIGFKCDNNSVPNPCTNENILNNKMRFKYPNSSTKYIQCTPTGGMEIVTCPTGTQYIEAQAVCGPEITNPPSNSTFYTGPNPCTREAIMKKQFYFANPYDITSFIQCDQWGAAFLVHCRHNTAWSQQAYTCVHHSPVIIPYNGICKSSKRNLPKYHQIPGDRKSFIECSQSGTVSQIRCPFGTLWSQAKLACIPASANLGSNNSSDSTSTVAPKKPSTQCTHGEYLPHKDPNKYYMCEWNGVLTEMPCPGGLVWSQFMKRCSWPSGTS